MKERRVSEIMTRDFISVKPETNLLECAKVMVKKKVGSLPLVQDKKLRGFISRKDILWALVKKSKNDLSKIKASDIAVKKIATIKPKETVENTLKKMKKYKFRRLPVVQNKEIIGLVTIRDILNFHPEIYPELEEFSKIREESTKLKRLKSKEKYIENGICEECGCTDIVYKVDGRLLCEECKNSM